MKNLLKKGNQGAEILLDRLQFLVDRFHIKGHTTPKCDLNNSECLYHPDLVKFSELSDVNTECAEQCFSWLGKCKGIMNSYMSMYKFHFMLLLVIHARNTWTVKKLKREGKSLTPMSDESK